MSLVVNARVTAGAMGGQQRVAAEIARRIPGMAPVSPGRPLHGMRGHAWEQAILPLRAWGRWLWSPSASGPLAHERQVVTLHDVAFIDVPHYFSSNFVRLYSNLIPRLVHRVAKVVTVSEFSRQRIAAAFQLDPAAIAVIPNGVDRSFRPCTPDEIATARQELQLPARYVLLQATSDRRKNLAGSLAAWRLAQERLDPEIELVVSGHVGRSHVFGPAGGTERPPRTRMIGFVPDRLMAPLMAGADAFLFPSFYEGFGLPVVEAMACGVPVITAGVTATAEIAADAALLVEPHDPQAIADAIVRLAGDPGLRGRLVTAGFERSARYCWDDAAARYRALFAELGALPA